MFRPSNNLLKAIKEQDKTGIKSSIVYLIKTDPTFEKNDVEEAINYVNRQGIQICEEYKVQDGENLEEDKTKWTEHYFYLITNWLADNFAPKERLPHIKEVGKSVFKSTHAQLKKEESFIKEKREGHYENPTIAPSRSRRSHTKTVSTMKIFGVIGAVVALVGVIVWLIKIFK